MARDEGKHIPPEVLHQQALHRDEATNTVAPLDAAEEVEREVAEREKQEQTPRPAESAAELVAITERAVEFLLETNDTVYNPAAKEAVVELSRTLDAYLGGAGNEPTWVAAELASGTLSKEGGTMKERFQTELSVRLQRIGDALFDGPNTLQSSFFSSRSDLTTRLRHIAKGPYDKQEVETVFQLIEGLSAEAQPIPTEVHPPDITDPQYEQYLVDNLAAMRREYGIELTKGDFFARRAAAAVHELDILAESYDERDDAGEPEHAVVAAAELLASWIDEHGTHFEQARTDAGLTRAVQSTHFFRGDTTEAIQLLRAADTVKQADPQLALRLFGVVAGEEGGREKPSDLFGNPLQLAMVRSQKILDKKHVVTDGSALASHALKGLRTFEQGPQGVYGHSVELPSLPDDALDRLDRNKEALLFPNGNLDHVSLVMLSRYFPTLEMRRFMTEAAKESVEEEYMRELAEGTPDEFLSALEQMPLELCQSDDVLAIVEQRLQLRHPDVQFRKHVLDALAMYDHSIKYSFTDTIRIRPESVAPTREDIPALINGMRMRHTPHPDADLQASNNYANPDEHRLRMVLWTSTPKAELLRHAKEFFENYAGGTRYLFRGATSHADLDGELFRVDSLAGAISVVPQPDVLTVEDWKQMIDTAVPDENKRSSDRGSAGRRFKEEGALAKIYMGDLQGDQMSLALHKYQYALNKPEARPGLLPAALDQTPSNLLLPGNTTPLAQLRTHKRSENPSHVNYLSVLSQAYDNPTYRAALLTLLSAEVTRKLTPAEQEMLQVIEYNTPHFLSSRLHPIVEGSNANITQLLEDWQSVAKEFGFTDQPLSVYTRKLLQTGFDRITGKGESLQGEEQERRISTAMKLFSQFDDWNPIDSALTNVTKVDIASRLRPITEATVEERESHASVVIEEWLADMNHCSKLIEHMPDEYITDAMTEKVKSFILDLHGTVIPAYLRQEPSTLATHALTRSFETTRDQVFDTITQLATLFIGDPPGNLLESATRNERKRLQQESEKTMEQLRRLREQLAYLDRVSDPTREEQQKLISRLSNELKGYRSFIDSISFTTARLRAQDTIPTGLAELERGAARLEIASSHTGLNPNIAYAYIAAHTEEAVELVNKSIDAISELGQRLTTKVPQAKYPTTIQGAAEFATLLTRHYAGYTREQMLELERLGRRISPS